ncbi:hypothetical protein GG344DRAFT_75507 [Lentinula edodes]|nr:hypothetical protein GG344DRAFT_75507 [Lentinula edodes]
MHFRVATYLIIMGLATQCMLNAVLVPLRNSKKRSFLTNQTNSPPTAPTAPTNATIEETSESIGISEKKAVVDSESDLAEILWSHEIHMNYMWPPAPFSPTDADAAEHLIEAMLKEHSHGKPRRSPDSPRFISNPELLSIKIISAVKDSIFMDVSAIKGQQGQQTAIEKEARWLLGNSRKGDYFGELLLLKLAPRAVTVSAVVRPTTLPTVDEESSSSSTPKKIGPKLKVAALDSLVHSGRSWSTT